MSRVAVLIPAAGEGRRLGLGPKAFVRVGGTALLAHVARSFQGVADELLIAVPPGREAEAAALAPLAEVLPGGDTRQDTVRALLARTRADVVLVHDVARPFAPPAAMARVLAAAQNDGAASAVLDVADTLHDATLDRAVPREALRLVQTPQAFERALLQRAHERARAHGLYGTDDAQLVRALPHAVTLVAGSPLSHKLTGPADLELLEALAHGLGFTAPRDVAPR